MCCLDSRAGGAVPRPPALRSVGAAWPGVSYYYFVYTNTIIQIIYIYMHRCDVM